MPRIYTHCYRCGTTDPLIFLPHSGVCRPCLADRNHRNRIRPPECHRCHATECAEGFVSNGYCRPCFREYRKQWYAEHREEQNRDSRSYYWRNHDAQRVRGLANRRELKFQAIAAYGGSCACCGEDRIEFLALDHINGNGKQERLKSSGAGAGYYGWLRRRGYPQGEIRVLCGNCNMSLGMYGYCPHRDDIRQAIPTGLHTGLITKAKTT